MKVFALVLALISTSHAGVVNPGGRWKKHSVKVCWMSAESIPKFTGNEEEQPLIIWHSIWGFRVTPPDSVSFIVQSAVEREFKISRTGIEFIGWKMCKSGDGSDAKIMNFKHHNERTWKDIEGKSTIGTEIPIGAQRELNAYGYDFPQEPWVLIKATPSSTPSSEEQTLFLQSLEYTAIHEFGHLAGLLHEDGKDEVEFSSGKSVRLSKDPDSIMSYFNSPLKKEPLGKKGSLSLSEKDIQALLFLYGEKK